MLGIGTLTWDLDRDQHLSLIGDQVGREHRGLVALLESSRAQGMRVCHEPPARVASPTLVVHDVAGADPLADVTLADLVHRAGTNTRLHICLVHRRQIPQLPSGFVQIVVGRCRRAQWWPPGLERLHLQPGTAAMVDSDSIRLGRY